MKGTLLKITALLFLATLFLACGFGGSATSVPTATEVSVTTLPSPISTEIACTHPPEFSENRGQIMPYAVAYHGFEPDGTEVLDILVGVIEVQSDGSAIDYNFDGKAIAFGPGPYTIDLRDGDTKEVYLDDCGTLWSHPDPIPGQQNS